MKVFVAYGYNERDKWIPQMVIPILEAFGIEVDTGKHLAGKIISEGVREKIEDCDALLGFLTRRDDLGNGTYSTHPWVIKEINAAWATNRKFIEVLENGVTSPLAASEERQYLEYDETHRDKFLLDLVQEISTWRTLRIYLRPGEFFDSVISLYDLGQLPPCSYFFNSSGKPTKKTYKGILVCRRMGAGEVYIVVDISDLPRKLDDVQIRVEIEVNGKIWRSALEPLNLLNVKMV